VRQKLWIELPRAVLLVLVGLAGPLSAQALTGVPNASVVLGPGFDQRPGAESWICPVFGLSGAYFPVPEWELGADFLMTGSVPGVGIDLNRFLTHQIFVGIQAGVDFTSSSRGHAGDRLDPSVGVQFGADWILTPQKIAFGLETQWVYDFRDQGSIYEVLGVFKWFFLDSRSSQ
jgi:hypothetical protein